MSGWRLGLRESLACGYAPGPGNDLSVTLAAGSIPPLPGLAPWESFYFEHSHLLMSREFTELVVTQIARLISHPNT